MQSFFYTVLIKVFLAIECTDENNVWVELHKYASAGKYCSRLIAEHLMLKNDEVWDKARLFFLGNENYTDLAKFLVYMHYIPDDKRFLSIAQILHWNGFGGHGQLLQYFSTCRPLLFYASGFHDFGDGKGFVFLPVALNRVNELREYANSTGKTVLLNYLIERESVSFLHIVSGPNFIAAAPIVSCLVEHGVDVSL